MYGVPACILTGNTVRLVHRRIFMAITITVLWNEQKNPNPNNV